MLRLADSGAAARRLAAVASQLQAGPSTSATAAATEWQPPPPRYAEVPRFPLGSDAAADFLEAHGFVVCAGALTVAECDEVLDGMWGWLESLGTGIDRTQPATWTGEAWPPDGGVGILTNAGVTHTDWAWRVRAHPSVVAAWQSVLKLPADDNAMIASLDGLTMFRPWGLPEAEAGWVTRGGWWHMDQAVETTLNKGGQPVGGTHREYALRATTSIVSHVHKQPMILCMQLFVRYVCSHLCLFAANTSNLYYNACGYAIQNVYIFARQVCPGVCDYG